MGYARTFAKEVANPGPPDDLVPRMTYHSAICADSRVAKGIVFMSSKL